MGRSLVNRLSSHDEAFTSGASCPDTMLDAVMHKVLAYVKGAKDPVEVVEELVG